MKGLLLVSTLFVMMSCSTSNNIRACISSTRDNVMSGTAFYKTVVSMGWKERDSVAANEILSGNIPAFLKKFVPVFTSVTNGGRTHKAIIYVSADYLSVGNDDDFARIPLTPMTAQRIADSLHCFLPTKKIVDLIYEQSKIKLEPVPMFAYRDSSVTMWQHHLMIEGLRKQQKGLIAGIKKDVIITDKLTTHPRPDRVAIYGWHKLDGKAIQPVHTKHVNFYVDYSHGIRLVYRKIKVDGKWMDYEDILKDAVLQQLLCDEATCNFTRYAY